MKDFPIKIALIFISSTILLACSQPKTKLEGYVDADYTYISSYFSANLSELFVSRGDSITKGQPLFMLESQPQKAELQNAQARLTRAIVQMNKQQDLVNYHTKLYERYVKLFKMKGISREELDKEENNHRTALITLKETETDVQGAKAEFEKAQWNSSAKMIYAPISGFVYDTYYTVGEFVQTGRAVLVLLKPENIKIVFYSPEPLISSLHINQNISITCDNCKKPIPATIRYISSQGEYTPPVIYSESERTKLLYRVEAKLLKPSSQLKPGQPVTVIIIRS